MVILLRYTERIQKGGKIFTMKSTAEMLIELRGDKTLKEVADSLGVTVAALSNYEQGIRTPRDEIKIRIAKYYEKTVEQLFLPTKYTN